MNIGQTVKVIPEVKGFAGMVGKIVSIDPLAPGGARYAVRFAWGPLYYMFSADELTVIEEGGENFTGK